MNYFICFINSEDFDWCALETTDMEYAHRVFEDLLAPPGWKMELRCTEEDIDTYINYELLRYDYSNY